MRKGTLQFMGAILGAGILLWGGQWVLAEAQLAGFKPTPIRPGRVNFVAFDLKGNFRIRVSNRVAKLVEGSGSFERGSDREGDDRNARIIPIREFLGSLQGDPKALGLFVERIERFNEEELPPIKVVWKADDLQKALDGDLTLQKKLERDLHIGLDGLPPSEIRPSAILNGIIVEVPVPVNVPIEGQVEVIEGPVRVPFRPGFASRVENEAFNEVQPSQEKIIGTYERLARELIENPARRQNVRESLNELIKPAKRKSMGVRTSDLLKSARVLANDSMMLDGSVTEYKDDRGQPLVNMNIRLTDDGRKRLWQYSRNTRGFALMLVVDGVAIAAPRISSELAEPTVTIAGMPEGDLAKMALNVLRETRKTPTGDPSR